MIESACARRIANSLALAFAALVVALVVTGAATATFPGRNGLIAFASDRDPLLQHPQIFAASVRGGRARNLSASALDDYDAAPSPDGRLVAFARRGGVWLMNADGSDQRLLVAGGEQPTWSPDGKTIAFNGGGPGECPPEAFRCGHLVAVWTVRLDGSTPRRFPPASRNASWSPNGRRLAFEGGVDPYGDAHGIRVANANGTKARWVARDGAWPAWSPDGRLIAYMGPRGIHVVRPDGTRRRRIAHGSFPTWAPRGIRLAYLCERSRDGETYALCVSDVDRRRRFVVARGVRPLAAFDGNEPLGAAWSTRGLRLAYARSDGIFVVNADGRSRKRVLGKTKGHALGSLAWSPDGRRLVFTQWREYNDLEIYTVSADGSNATPLTDNAVDDLQPSWAPDGTRLAFVRLRLLRNGSVGSADIWVMDASGGGQLLVTQHGFDPSWTADGKSIVFSRYDRPTTEPYSTYSVSASGGVEQLLASGSHGAQSPDGTKLAFLRTSTRPEQLLVAAADGSGATSLTPAATTDSLSWSPDSSTLAFGGNSSGGQSANAIYTIPLDGSELRLVASEAHSPSFSPDGAAIAFVRGRGQIELSGVGGSGRRVVTAARGRNVDPDWQPLSR